MDRKTLERFNAKINKQPVPMCWLWIAGTNSDGYGQFHLVHGHPVGAHRLAYELWRGPIPDGLCVLHKCDTPACVNPVHLFLGTQLENIADRVAKGRSARGIGNHKARLSEVDVIEIRKLYVAGGISYAELGKRYGVTYSTTFRIVNRRSWRHVT